MIEVSSDAQEVAAAMRAVSDTLRSGELIGQAIAPLPVAWVSGLSARAAGAQDQRALVDGATALVDGASLVLEAWAGPQLSGGLIPSATGAAVEFGSARPGLPPRTAGGRVAIPTARGLGHEYVQLTDDALEGAYREAVGDAP